MITKSSDAYQTLIHGSSRGQIKNVKLDLPLFLRQYRASLHEKTERTCQVEVLLESGTIKESNRPRSAPVTLVMNQAEDKKKDLCTLKKYQYNN